MERKTSKNYQKRPLESANFVAILGIVAEMARRINENIAKAELDPLREALAATGSHEANATSAVPSKA